MAKLALNIDEEGGCLKIIIEKARKFGSVNYQELIDCLSSRGITDLEQIEDIVAMLKDMGFKVSN